MGPFDIKGVSIWNRDESSLNFVSFYVLTFPCEQFYTNLAYVKLSHEYYTISERNILIPWYISESKNIEMKAVNVVMLVILTTAVRTYFSLSNSVEFSRKMWRQEFTLIQLLKKLNITQPMIPCLRLR